MNVIPENELEFWDKVREGVKASLADEKWFDGKVNMTGISQFYPEQFDAAIEHARNETIYWNMPLKWG